MLRAYLEGKLYRTLARAIGEMVPVGASHAWRAALHRDEDTLTAALFERLSYLPPGHAWGLLHAACAPLTPASLPTLPEGRHTWRFWPSWRPAPGDRNTVRVEPDVVLLCPGLVVLFECKLRAPQDGRQWASQIRAARQAMPWHDVIHVAAGGGAIEQLRVEADRAIAELASHLEAPAPLFALPWARLRSAADRLSTRKSLHPGEQRIVTAITEVLTDRGYQPRRPLRTLRGAAVDERCLDAWRPAPTTASRLVGLASLRAKGIRTTPADLAAWRLK